MNLLNGSYLGKEICAFCDDWLIVYDGDLNYMVFSMEHQYVKRAFKRNRLPSNDVSTQMKSVEYFSNFDNALEMGLLNIVGNGGHFD